MIITTEVEYTHKLVVYMTVSLLYKESLCKPMRDINSKMHTSQAGDVGILPLRKGKFTIMKPKLLRLSGSFRFQKSRIIYVQVKSNQGNQDSNGKQKNVIQGQRKTQQRT